MIQRIRCMLTDLAASRRKKQEAYETSAIVESFKIAEKEGRLYLMHDNCAIRSLTGMTEFAMIAALEDARNSALSYAGLIHKCADKDSAFPKVLSVFSV